MLTAETLLSENPRISEYKQRALDLVKRTPKPAPTMMRATYGNGQNLFSRDAGNEFSIQRLIQSKDPNAGARKHCVEEEISQDLSRKYNQTPTGDWVDYSALGQFQKRDMQVGIFNQGGAFMPTQVMTPTIDLPYNKACCLRLGASQLSGLQGNVVIPRQLSASTPQSLGEIDLVAGSDLTMDQLAIPANG